MLPVRLRTVVIVAECSVAAHRAGSAGRWASSTSASVPRTLTGGARMPGP
ncbi:hypothetical protein [Nonomuraea sp. NPDC049309]